MGTSRSAAELAGKLLNAGAAIEKTAVTGVGAVALSVKKSVQFQLAAAGAGSGRLRGVGTKGAKISVGYKLIPGPHPTAVVSMRGPAHLLESSTKAHTIKAKRKRAIITPYGPRASVKHPGTRGKHPWAKGVAAAVPAAPRIFQSEVRAGLLKVFR